MKQLLVDLRQRILSLSYGDYSYVETTFVAGPFNDGIFSGAYTGQEVTDIFIVTITGLDQIGDTFSWASKHGSGTGVKILGLGMPQLLTDGISIAFTSFKDHLIGDKWVYTISSTPVVKFCQVWNNQLRDILPEGGAKMYSFAMPAVFIEFVAPNQIQQMGDGVQLYEPLLINLHILHEFYNSTDDEGIEEQDLTIFDLRERIYQGLQLHEFNGAVAFVRVGEEQDFDHPNVYHFVQQWQTNYEDQVMRKPVGGIWKQPPTTYLLQYMFDGFMRDYCADAGAFLLAPAAKIPGGTYRGTGVIDFLGDQYFDPSVGIGTYDLIYTVYGMEWKLRITVHPLPEVSMPPTLYVDKIATPFYTLSGASPPGGIYYVDGVQMAVVDTAAVGDGPHDVVYTYTGQYGCASQAQQVLTIGGAIVADPTPNYVDVTCPNFTKTTIQYTTGLHGDILYCDLYIETCNVNNNRPAFVAFHPAAATRTHVNPVTWAKDFASRNWAGGSADFGHEVQGVQFTNAQQKKCIANGCALIRYLKAHSAELGINPNNIIVWGKSAGALIAAGIAAAANAIDANKLLADPTTGDWWYPVNLENDTFSSAPAGSGSESGAINSAVNNYIDAGDHEHHFYNGDQDCTVPYSSTCGFGPGAVENYNAMIDVGQASTFVPIHNYAHDIGAFHSQILLGGLPQVVGHAQLVYANNTFTTDIGIVQKFKNLLVP